MKTSINVMAHPAREHLIPELLEQLGDVPVIWDQRSDRWDTGRRALLAHDPDADWGVTVQDDALLCRDFVAGVHAALAAVPPEVPVSFYTGRTRQPIVRLAGRAGRSGRAWLAMPGPRWGVCVAIPTTHIERMVEWCSRWVREPNYDLRMMRYFAGLHIDCWYSYPSLVDHRVGQGNPSLVKGRSARAERVALRFIGERSPLEVDWSTGSVQSETQRRRPAASLPSVSMALMAHPRRAALVDELRAQVPDAEVVWDKHHSLWDTGRRALLAHDPQADYHVVLQDDAVLCAEFTDGIRHALAAVPDGHPVSFYVGQVRPNEPFVRRQVNAALKGGAPWIVMKGPWWGVAIAVPTADVPELVEHGDISNLRSYDVRISDFYNRQGIDCWYTQPSLVDHRADVDSLTTTRRGRPRQAFLFAGARTPVTIDWTLNPRWAPGSTRGGPIPRVRQWRAAGGGKVRAVIIDSPSDRRYEASPRWEEVPT